MNPAFESGPFTGAHLETNTRDSLEYFNSLETSSEPLIKEALECIQDLKYDF